MDYKKSRWEYSKLSNYDAILLYEGEFLKFIASPIYRNAEGKINLHQTPLLLHKNGTGSIEFLFDAIARAEGLEKNDRETFSELRKMHKQKMMRISEIGDLLDLYLL